MCRDFACYGVSILVVVDQFPEDGFYQQLFPRLRFQSLLWWISFRRLLKGSVIPDQIKVSILVVVDQFPEVFLMLGIDLGTVSFNPCCGGSVSGGEIVPVKEH